MFWRRFEAISHKRRFQKQGGLQQIAVSVTFLLLLIEISVGKAHRIGETLDKSNNLRVPGRLNRSSYSIGWFYLGITSFWWLENCLQKLPLTLLVYCQREALRLIFQSLKAESPGSILHSWWGPFEMMENVVSLSFLGVLSGCCFLNFQTLTHTYVH